MSIPGIDYAWQHPDPAAIAAAGYRFACRYLSHDASKNITLAEAQALAAHGLWVVSNWEYYADDALRGYAGGVADAQTALAQAKAAGMPAGRPIYFSADWDVTPDQEAAVTDYLRGAASVLGAGAVGEYAGFYPVRIARDNGTAWTWQTSAWSGGQWDARDTIRQTGTAVVGGVQVDVNEAWTEDYGQWQPGRLPDIAGVDMPLTDADVQLILNTPLPRQGGAMGGETTLGGLVSWSDQHVVDIEKAVTAASGSVAEKVDALAAAVAKLGAPAPATVDLAALEALIEQHLAAGSVPGVIAVAVAKHLGADLAAG